MDVLGLQPEGHPPFFSNRGCCLEKMQPRRDVGKLEPRWEGPYKVREKLSSEAYYVCIGLEGKVIGVFVECFLPLTLLHLRGEQISYVSISSSQAGVNLGQVNGNIIPVQCFDYIL